VTLRDQTRDAIVAAITKSEGLSTAIVRRSGSPRLFDLESAASSWHLDAASMLASSFGLSDDAAAAHIEEARTALADVEARSADVARVYPDYYLVEGSTALLLHAVVRVLTPTTVLETGVADGLSSALVLAAMDANGTGELHSIDIAHDVGRLVADRTRWRLHVVEPNRPSACAEVITQLPALDIFFHDGNHALDYQAAEYAAAWPRLRPGGVLLSDDIDWSYAFLDFLDAGGLSAPMLMDRRKVFGLVRKP
jgi:predicted O-methyltransferase YrrM